MATSILSSVGSAVAGPLGAAVGGFVGRQVDRQLRGTKASARITDLRIQNSSYGAEIPVITGALRVAGTVIWASDIVEGLRASKSGSQTARAVSFAVALSSSVIGEVGRIWADGRLVRGAAGDHKIPFDMRLLSGDEDQLADPLIASFEGITTTPAYRGVGLLVFENFDLGSFGNRIPQINVELNAAEESAGVQTIVASRLKLEPLEPDNGPSARGFALQGDTVAAALAPLVELFRTSFSFGQASWQVNATPTFHRIDRLECGALDDGADEATRFANTPSKVTIRYFDDTLDYGLGEKVASLQGSSRGHRIEFPGTLTSHEAKARAHHHLAAYWSERRRVRLSLPLTRAVAIRLGDRIELAEQPDLIFAVASKVVREAYVELLLLAEVNAPGPMRGDAGFSKRETDDPPLAFEVVLFELPAELNGSVPTMAVATGGGARPYRRTMLDARASGASLQVASAGQEAVIGKLTTALPYGPSSVLDLANSIDVQVTEDKWLLSVDDSDLLAGANVAVVGNEVLQFGTAEAIGSGRYRLSRLIRGRYSTTVPIAHEVGTPFVLLEEGRYATLPITPEMIGSRVDVRAVDPSGSDVIAVADFKAACLLPRSPAHLSASWRGADLQLAWIRRSRSGAPWLDHVDAPLGEGQEEYRVTLEGSDGAQITISCPSPAATVSAQALAVLGARPWHISVCQIGDFGPSHACSLTIEE